MNVLQGMDGYQKEVILVSTKKNDITSEEHDSPE